MYIFKMSHSSVILFPFQFGIFHFEDFMQMSFFAFHSHLEEFAGGYSAGGCPVLPAVRWGVKGWDLLMDQAGQSGDVLHLSRERL